MNLSSSPVGRRRRKRSGSGSGSRSRSRSKSRIRSTEKGGPPESLRFIYRTSDPNGLKFHLLTIPSKEVEFFKQVDVNCYTRHDHSKCDSTNFRDITSIYPPDFLLHSPLNPFSRVCPVGKNIYFILSELGEPLQFCSYSLDALHFDHKLLTSPICQSRYFARAFSLCGKVYLCAGLVYYPDDPELESQPFGEVYDPDTGTWSPIPRPANTNALISTKRVFVASLGDSNAKFLVYDYKSAGLVHIYDVVTQEWMTPLEPPEDFRPDLSYTPPVINKDDNLLYWIDIRRGFMYAFDWKDMNIYSGPVVGLEHSRVLSCLKDFYHAVCLNHLWEDYFCLVWSTRSSTDSDITENHFTFLKVVKYPPTDSLEAFVIGCFVDLNRGSPPFIFDSISF